MRKPTHLLFTFTAQPSVDIKTVLSRLMERLSNYAGSSVEVSKIRNFTEL